MTTNVQWLRIRVQSPHGHIGGDNLGKSQGRGDVKPGHEHGGLDSCNGDVARVDVNIRVCGCGKSSNTPLKVSWGCASAPRRKLQTSFALSIV